MEPPVAAHRAKDEANLHFRFVSKWIKTLGIGLQPTRSNWCETFRNGLALISIIKRLDPAHRFTGIRPRPNAPPGCINNIEIALSYIWKKSPDASKMSTAIELFSSQTPQRFVNVIEQLWRTCVLRPAMTSFKDIMRFYWIACNSIRTQDDTDVSYLMHVNASMIATGSSTLNTSGVADTGGTASKSSVTPGRVGTKAVDRGGRSRTGISPLLGGCLGATNNSSAKQYISSNQFNEDFRDVSVIYAAILMYKRYLFAPGPQLDAMCIEDLMKPEQVDGDIYTSNVTNAQYVFEVLSSMSVPMFWKPVDWVEADESDWRFFQVKIIADEIWRSASAEMPRSPSHPGTPRMSDSVRRSGFVSSSYAYQVLGPEPEIESHPQPKSRIEENSTVTVHGSDSSSSSSSSFGKGHRSEESGELQLEHLEPGEGQNNDTGHVFEKDPTTESHISSMHNPEPPSYSAPPPPLTESQMTAEAQQITPRGDDNDIETNSQQHEIHSQHQMIDSEMDELPMPNLMSESGAFVVFYTNEEPILVTSMVVFPPDVPLNRGYLAWYALPEPSDGLGHSDDINPTDELNADPNAEWELVGSVHLTDIGQIRVEENQIILVARRHKFKYFHSRKLYFEERSPERAVAFGKSLAEALEKAYSKKTEEPKDVPS